MSSYKNRSEELPFFPHLFFREYSKKANLTAFFQLTENLAPDMQTFFWFGESNKIWLHSKNDFVEKNLQDIPGFFDQGKFPEKLNSIELSDDEKAAFQKADMTIECVHGLELTNGNQKTIGWIFWGGTLKSLEPSQRTILLNLSDQIASALLKEQKLNELERKIDQYENVQSLSQTGGWELDVTTGQTRWSKEVYNIHQIPQGTPTNKIDGISYYAEHERPKLIKYIENCIGKKEPFDDIFEFFDSEKNHKWVRSIGNPRLDEQGNVTKLVGTFQDVTELKRRQKELKESNTYLALALEGAGLGIWDWFLETNAVKFDRRWAEMLGLDVNEISMELKTWEERVHPDDLANCYEDIQAYMRGETDSYENIHRMRHVNGQWVYILDRGRFSDWDKDGNPTRFTGTHMDITRSTVEHKNQLQELNEILSSTPSCLKIITRAGKLIEMNAQGLDLIEAESFEEVDGANVYDIVEESHRDRYIEFNEKICKGEQGELTFEIVGLKGTRRWMETYAAPYKLPSGEMAHIAITNDVTQKIKDNLQANTYKKGLDEYAIVAKTDPNGVIKDVNENFCKISGYSREELIGKTHRLINSSDHSKEFWKQFWSSIKSGKVWRGEIKNRAKDGSYYWVDTTIAPSVDSHGNITEFVAFRYDITERKSNMQKLAELAGLNEGILDSNTDGILVIDHRTRKITKVNQSFFNLWNIPQELRENRDDNKLLAYVLGQLEEPEEFLNLVEKLYQEPSHESDDQIEFKNGNIFERKSFPLRENGQPVARIWVFRDITEKINAQVELENQRKLSAHNAKLASIGELAAGVGHEINNPLAIAKGYLFNLKRKIDARNPDLFQEELKVLGKVDYALNRVAKIVQGLRTFSRIDSNENVIFNCIEALEESISMISEIYANEGVNLQVISVNEAQGFLVDGHRGRFQQIIINLLSNAKDALQDCPEKKITVLTQIRKDQIVIQVEDTGKGIPQNVVDKIFDPFFTTKDVNHGTGIGLSLVNNFLKEMGGQISVESLKDKGTCFTLQLPGKFKDQSKAPKKDNSGQQERPLLNQVRALLVEDEPDLREVMQELLEEIDIQVTTARNGQEGFDLYSKQPNNFDLILSDMKMPEMGGEEFLKKIRHEISQDQQPLFLIMTGGINENFEDGSNPLSPLIDGFIYKPFNESEIHQKIGDLFRKQKKNKSSVA